MTAIIVILIIFAFLYLIIALVTISGIAKKTAQHNKNTPFVSVILAAKDEEGNIQNCLNSLKNINYPPAKIEYLLVNDRSQDKTRFYMKQFSDQMDNVKILDIENLPNNRTGKINALIKGANAAQGEVLIFTDADCEVPGNWVKSFINHIDSDTGMLCGFLVLDKKNKTTPLWHYLQTIDWIYITSIGYGWTKLGRPLSIFGNNFAIKKDIYEECDGFESVKDHITEDYALMENVLARTNAKVNFILDPENVVYTNPVNTLSAFFSQRKRWAVGCLKRKFLSILLPLTSVLLRLLIIIALFSQIFMLGLTAMLFIIFLDTAILFHPLKKLHRLNLLKYIFLFEIYVTIYQIFFTPLALFAKKIIWKSDKYSIY